MTVLAGCGEENAKFGCPIVGQVGINLGLTALYLSIVLACDIMNWKFDTSEINYFWLDDFLTNKYQIFLITIQIFAIVVGPMILPRLALLRQTERTRGGPFSVRAPKWRLVRSMRKSLTGLRLNSNKYQDQPRCRVRMRAHTALPGLGSEVKPVRGNNLVSGESPKLARISMSSFLTQGLLNVLIVMWLLQDSCGTNDKLRATSSEFPAVSSNGWFTSKGRPNDLVDHDPVPLSVVANDKCHSVPQIVCAGHDVAHCCHHASAAFHLVCGCRNIRL